MRLVFSLGIWLGAAALLMPPSAWAQPAALPPPPPSPSGQPQAAPLQAPPPSPYAPSPGSTAAAPMGAPPPWAYPPPILPPYMLVPPTLPYADGQEIPKGYRLESRTNKPIFITGISMFSLAYGLSLGASLIILSAGGSESSEFAPLLIPLIGPFVTVGTARDGSTLFILDGVTQAVGAVLLGISIFKKDELLVRDDIKLSKATPEVFVGPKSASLRWTF